MAATRPDSASTALWYWAVVAWLVVFAAPHFYWAVGGRTGLGAQSAAADAAFQQGWFRGYNLIAGALGVLAAVGAAALARGWGGLAPRTFGVAGAQADLG